MPTSFIGISLPFEIAYNAIGAFKIIFPLFISKKNDCALTGMPMRRVFPEMSTGLVEFPSSR